MQLWSCFQICAFILLQVFSFVLWKPPLAEAVFRPITKSVAAPALITSVNPGNYVSTEYFKRENGGIPSSYSSTVNMTTGNIGREASVVWVELASNGVIVEKQKNVVAKINFSDVVSLTRANKSKYPRLEAATWFAYDAPPITKTAPAYGSTYKVNGSYYRFDSFWQGADNQNFCRDGYPYGSSGYEVGESGALFGFKKYVGVFQCSSNNTTWDGWSRFYFVTLVAAPAPSDATPERFAQYLSETGNILDPTIKAEIDDLLSNFGDSVSFVDATAASAMDSASPFTVTSPSLQELQAAYSDRFSTPKSCPLNQASGSSTSTASGNLSHSQNLFTTTGAPLSTLIDLNYRSLTVQDGPLGNGWSHSYETRLTVNADSSVTYRGSDYEWRLYTLSGSSYISPTGDHSTLTKNPDNSFTITYRSGLRQNFDPSGALTSIVDRYNNSLTLGYTAGDLTSITDSAQRVTRLAYDTAVTPHRLTSISDPDGIVYTFQYQNDRLWKVINPVTDQGMPAGFWEYTYNADGLLETKKDPNGNLTQYDYYPDLRMKSAIDPEGIADPTGHTRTFVYNDEAGAIKTTTFTEKDGGEWTNIFDTTTGLLKQKIDPDSKITAFAHYADGSLKAETAPHDTGVRLTTFYTYDSYGNLSTRTDPVDIATYTPVIDPETVDVATLTTLTPPIPTAISTSYDYSNFDQPAAITDHRGTYPTSTTFQYYPENGLLVTKATDPANNISYIRRNPNGTVKEIADANEKTTTYSYTATGLLESVTTPGNVTTRFLLYDDSGNPHEIRVKDTEGRDVITTRNFDPMNRLRKVTSFAADLPDNVNTYGYDNNGNLSSVIDPEQHETKHQHRYDGQVSKTTDARLKETIFTYGGTGCSSCGGGGDKLTGLTDARTKTTTFQYDTLGRLEFETDPMNKKIRYTYYDSGKVKEKIDATALPEQLLITYFYDDQDRLTKKRYADNSEETYSYDPKGNLATATNQNIGYTFAYYDNGWLKSVTDSNGRTISYDLYDGIGQRKQVTILPTTADQRVISYGYDSASRLSTIASQAGIFTFGYDTLSRRKSIDYPNQTRAEFGYDDLNRLTSLTHSANATAFLTYGYTHDQAGNRKTRTGTVPETYAYDELYRLKEAVTAKGTEKYSYDDVGNRTTGPGPKDTRYDFDDANRMTKGRLYDYAYDNMGNQTIRTILNATGKGWTLTWDAENRLTKMERTKGTTEKRTITFKYDPLGRRIEKKAATTKNGTTKTITFSYLYDNEDIVLETMTSDTTTEKTFYIHGPGIDEPLALERGGNYYYFHADSLGSITSITDSSKAIVQSYSYDSFGMPKPSTNFRNSYQSTGREWDKETGIYFYRARYYDPIDGRFVSKDPLSFAAGDVNLFNYVGANVINRTDLFGLWGDDVHSGINSKGYGTYNWATSVGFSNSEAYVLAVANANTDNNANWAPIAGVPGRHFNTASGKNDSRDIFAFIELNSAIDKYKKGDKSGAMETLGRGLHSIQDKYAHMGWIPIIVHPPWYDDVLLRPYTLENTRKATECYLNKFINAAK
jgi:RHS repeat-associated protein